MYDYTHNLHNWLKKTDLLCGTCYWLHLIFMELIHWLIIDYAMSDIHHFCCILWISFANIVIKNFTTPKYSYSGAHCEYFATGIIIRQYVSKTFGYVAIIALSTVAGFVIIMDILKYGFGIDPVQKERELIRRKHALLERENCIIQKRSDVIWYVYKSSSNWTIKF